MLGAGNIRKLVMLGGWFSWGFGNFGELVMLGSW